MACSLGTSTLVERNMPRRPEVRYYASRGAYYCQVHGRQHLLARGPNDGPLGPTYQAASAAYRRLLELDGAPDARDDNTVRVVCELYMRAAKRWVRPSTLATATKHLKPFVQEFGETRVSGLRLSDVEAWFDRMQEPAERGTRDCGWGPCTVAIAAQRIRAAFAWAAGTGRTYASDPPLIGKNPVARLRAGRVRSRGHDVVVTPELHQQVLVHLRGECTRRLVTALENTGARPGELVAARGTDWDDDLGALVYHADDRRREDDFRHKTAAHGKDRVIYFTGEALEMVRERVRKCPTGLLFPSQRGTAYTPQRVVQIFERAREALGVEGLTAYSYRHTFATRWLLQGKPVATLAEVLGNSPAVIYRHYAHLCTDQAAIRRQLEEFKSAERR
jgi:integrase